MAEVARSPQGFCIFCSLPIEQGEHFTRQNGAAIHVGCRASDSPPQGDGGFFLTAVAAPSVEKKPESRQVQPVQFDGPTLDATDSRRLVGQLRRTRDLMSDGEWHTLSEVARTIGGLETSASSRVRDLRKPQFGGYTIISRQSESDPSVREYRMETESRERAA